MTGTPPAARDALLDLRADMSFSARNRLAMRDVASGTSLWRLAWTLGWLDIKLRYRGSMLGPFWLTLSTGIMVGSLGVLYSTLFHMNVQEYLPFLSLSIVLWNFLSALVSEACLTFTEADSVIRSVRMPFFVFAIRIVMRNLLALAHNILVIAVVFAVFLIWPGWHALLAFPALVALGGGCARPGDVARQLLRAVPRHSADREQRHADRLLPDAGDLEARTTQGPSSTCCRSARSSTCWTSFARHCSATYQPR